MAQHSNTTSSGRPAQMAALSLAPIALIGDSLTQLFLVAAGLLTFLALSHYSRVSPAAGENGQVLRLDEIALPLRES